jgi:hypothetical protein
LPILFVANEGEYSALVAHTPRFLAATKYEPAAPNPSTAREFAGPASPAASLISNQLGKQSVLSVCLICLHYLRVTGSSALSVGLIQFYRPSVIISSCSTKLKPDVQSWSIFKPFAAVFSDLLVIEFIGVNKKDVLPQCGTMILQHVNHIVAVRRTQDRVERFGAASPGPKSCFSR